ncbi:MAG: dihydroorotase [candidate division Zixibacteria bacterium]|nr:dihydroorotase [candidate division Zixibacteria bacterium]
MKPSESDNSQMTHTAQDIIIQNGRVIDPASGFNGLADIYVHSGRISKVLKGKKSSGTKASRHNAIIIDARGKLVVPGLIDMHVHLREPGREDEETILSGSQSAAAGGFTSICCMPNTRPPLDSQEKIKFVIEKARRADCRVYPIGAITKNQAGKELAEMAEMFEAGAIAFSDDGNPVMNSEVMRRGMEYAKMFDVPILDHCQDLHLSSGGVMNESFNSTILGLPGIPPVSEELMVYRDIRLAEYTGSRVHIAHVSTAGSVDLIRQAKKKTIKVTCEVTPHHFTLTDDSIKSYDPNFKMNPPLRTKKDVEAMKNGLADDTIDCIASDHAPHSPEEKETEFDQAPFGIVGLETSLGLVITELIEKKVISWEKAVAKMSTEPARILNLQTARIKEGFPADITIIDPVQTWKVEPARFKSKSKNTPFGGRKLRGCAICTIMGGKITFQA